MCHQVTYTSSPAKVKICHCSLKQNTFPLFTLVAERPQQVTSKCCLMNFFMVVLLSRCHPSRVWRDCVHTEKWICGEEKLEKRPVRDLHWPACTVGLLPVVLAKMAWAHQCCWGPKWHQVHTHAQHMAGDPGTACFYLALCQLAGLIQHCPRRGPEWEVSGEKELRRGSLAQLEDPLLIFTRLSTHGADVQGKPGFWAKRGSSTTQCHAAAGCARPALGITEGAGLFPEFICSVLCLIHCFALFSLRHHIPPDMTAFQSSFWGEFFVCLFCFFFQNTAEAILHRPALRTCCHILEDGKQKLKEDG